MTAGLHTVKARLKMSLPPAQTKDIEAGVREYLNGMLLRHNKMFDGIVLGYDSEHILEKAAPVSPYFTYVNVTVDVRLSVFRPRKGMLLPGLVNKIGSDFIGLLVLGTFNCAIPQALIRRELQARELEQTWVSKKDPRHVISVGSHVMFEVADLVLGSDHCSLLGSLESPKTGSMDIVGELPADPVLPPRQKRKAEATAAAGTAAPAPAAEGGEAAKKRKKEEKGKEKKDKKEKKMGKKERES